MPRKSTKPKTIKVEDDKPKSKSSDLSAGFGNLPTVRPVGRPRLSDEERKERLKESNRKYYEKMRLLIKKAKSI
jgi:hypothetical protein